MRLLLIRHTTPDVPAGQCYGRRDVPAHAAGLASWLADWDAGRHAGQPWQGYRRLLSSPARRCAVLADALAGRLALPVETDPDWQEMDFGAWEGQTWDAIGRAAVDAWAADAVQYAPGGGESALAMMHRVASGAERLRAAGQDAVLVCHGGPIRMLQAWRAVRADCPDAGCDAAVRQACDQAVRLAAPAPGAVLMLEW